jgi:hypothetical protein
MVFLDQSEVCFLKKPRNSVLRGGNWLLFEMIVLPSASLIGSYAEPRLSKSTRLQVFRDAANTTKNPEKPLPSREARARSRAGLQELWSLTMSFLPFLQLMNLSFNLPCWKSFMSRLCQYCGVPIFSWQNTFTLVGRVEHCLGEVFAQGEAHRY